MQEERTMKFHRQPNTQVAGAIRRWRWPFRCRGLTSLARRGAAQLAKRTRTMKEIYLYALFWITGLVWFVTWLCAHRLLHAFCDRFPLVAQREIPYAFNRGMAHPEKVIFLFRRRMVEFLRGDPLLWRQRQRFILLTVLSVLIPVLGIVSMSVVALIEVYK
jgi:hypothetical protein